jgi:hypothetical protein
MTDTSYIFYNSPGSKRSIDRNTPSRIGEFPKDIYTKNPLNPSKCFPNSQSGVCQDYIKDPSIDYFIDDGTVKVHPPHFSRFGYIRCPNGYCTGNHPGRYNTPPGEIPFTDSQPLDMAPPRFYTSVQLSPFYCTSEAYIEARRFR